MAKIRWHKVSRNMTGAVRSVALASLTLLCAGTALPAHAAKLPMSVKDVAVGAMRQLERDFYDPHAGLYRATGGLHEPYIAVWPTSQVLSAAIGLARLSRTQENIARVRRIINSLHIYASPQGGYHARIVRSLRYYDDNNWVALDLLDAYALLHDQSYLSAAKNVFDYLITGWDTQHGGGLIWADGHTDRPTVSTAPAITIALRLAAVTHQATYRTWANRLYAWENSKLSNGHGLYWDHIDGVSGAIDRDIVSYNQGVMIDANIAYAKLTGKQAYLAEARRIATATASAMTGPWHNHGRYAAFDAIYFAAVAHLNAASPHAASLDQANAYLQWAWPTASAKRLPANRTEEDILEQAGYVITAVAVAGA
ncbi:MAG: glycoside hydrolase family 76 [Chloroflexi bacterium]|nr:glycoside hydrolase family 76 [Chloroflexota bacterium]